TPVLATVIDGHGTSVEHASGEQSIPSRYGHGDNSTTANAARYRLNQQSEARTTTRKSAMPGKIRPYTVPMLVKEIEMDESMDLSLRRILEHIKSAYDGADGSLVTRPAPLDCVEQVRRKTGISAWVVHQCLKYAEHLGVIEMVDMFHLGNVYRPTHRLLD